MVSSCRKHVALAQRGARGLAEAVKCTVKNGTTAVAVSRFHRPNITLGFIALSMKPLSGWSVSGATCLSFYAREPQSFEASIVCLAFTATSLINTYEVLIVLR